MDIINLINTLVGSYFLAFGGGGNVGGGGLIDGGAGTGWTLPINNGSYVNCVVFKQPPIFTWYSGFGCWSIVFFCFLDV